MSGATDLIGLIDLSLGEKPSGVVNFNYLHSLLHEIVRRLGIYEEQQMSITGGPVSGYNMIQNIDSSGRIIRGSTVTIPEHGPLSDTSLPVGIAGQGIDSADGTPTHSSSVSTSVASRSGQQPHLSTTSITGTPAHPSSQPPTGTIPGTGVPGSDTQPSSSIPTMGQSSSLPMAAGSNQSVAMTTGQQSSPTVNEGVTSAGQPTPMHSGSTQVKQSSAGGLGGGPTVGGTNVGGTNVNGANVGGANVSGSNVREGEDRIVGDRSGDRSGHTSSSDISGRLPSTSNRLRRNRSSVASAANDLGYLERKLNELESRVNTMETLPELMERKGSDTNATPIRDMWNFTNLNGKVKSVEDGIDKTSQLVDDLLGEVQALKQQLGEVQGSVGKRLDSLDNKVAQSSNEASKLEEELKQLKALKMAASSDSPSEAFMGIVNELQEKVDGLETESNVSKEKLKQLQGELGKAVSSEDFTSLQDSVKDFSGTTDSRLTVLQGKIDASDFTIEGNMKTLSASMENLSDQMKTLETALSDKVSASDLTSLMPTGTNDGDSTAALLSELLKLQNKVHALEDNASKQPSVPSDLMDKVNSMQNAIDHLSTELSKLARMDMGGADSGRLDDLGSQIAQLKERMEESDIAIGALTNALSEQGVAVCDDKTGEYVDIDSFKGLQELVQNLQESQERLLGTLANISHELEVNQEHVKALYSTVDDLRATKVDKNQLAIEVDEKADRSALEGKASREWVDSTFERLDREIREAKSHLLGQEEAFRSAVGQLNEDVEGKLDRMELEPFKEYIDEKFQRIKTAPVNVDRHEHIGEDAAGFRKPMRFRCISCDKPLGLKSTDPIPTLPMTDTLPPTKSFRPYTTYELELIRRHQRIQPAVLGPPPSFPVSIRSAGGSHTLTRPHQKIRVTPYSAGSIPENTNTTTKSMPSVFVHDEMDIVGQDGHIYKGRMMKQSLPPVSLRKYPRNRATKVVRPASTTPLQTIPS